MKFLCAFERQVAFDAFAYQYFQLIKRFVVANSFDQVTFFQFALGCWYNCLIVMFDAGNDRSGHAADLQLCQRLATNITVHDTKRGSM